MGFFLRKITIFTKKISRRLQVCHRLLWCPDLSPKKNGGFFQLVSSFLFPGHCFFLPFFVSTVFFFSPPLGFEPRQSQKRRNVDQRLAESGWRDSYRRGWKQSRSTRTSGQGVRFLHCSHMGVRDGVRFHAGVFFFSRFSTSNFFSRFSTSKQAASCRRRKAQWWCGSWRHGSYTSPMGSGLHGCMGLTSDFSLALQRCGVTYGDHASRSSTTTSVCVLNCT